ncbi:MAG TPA: aspartyl/asparaginyl beta-hydroxylase domain-containing protein [Kofleriaceae bacterium]
MRSFPLGLIDLDDARLAPELAAVLACNVTSDAYSEFKLGSWRTVVLWNTSGQDGDGLIASGDVPARPTPRAQPLGYLDELIARTFDVSRLRLVRAHILEDGVLIPHRDFLELAPDEPRWCRLHLPIATTTACLHSEEDTVFHMRRGEVWFLDASQTHSACNNGTTPRVTLCLDFALGDRPIESLVADRHQLRPTSPVVIARDPLDRPFRAGIRDLARLINRHNYREILNFLARVHFYKAVDINEFFAWIVEVASAAGDRELTARLDGFGRFLRSDREMHERYAL